VVLVATGLAGPIHDAARDGDLAGVQELLDAGADVNAKDNDGWTPLHIAASKNHREIVELLIAKGADVNAAGESSSVFIWQGGFTPLHYAAVNGHKEIVELLISKGADVNAKADNGLTPRDWAIKRTHTKIADLLRTHGGKTSSIHFGVGDGDLAGVQALLDAGVDVNAKDENGQTPLHHAVRYDHKEIAELLIDKGADVNAKDNSGNTPLDLAIRYEKFETADLLRTHDGKARTIFVVVTNGDLAGVQALLDAGVDVNAKDENSWTPLHFAARHGHKEIVELLIAKGADVNAKDNGDNTPLNRATARNHIETADLLRTHGGNTAEELKALIDAARNDNLTGVQALLDVGVDVNAKDENSWTPLHFAVVNGHKEIVELLIDNDADVNAKDELEETPLDFAGGQTADFLRIHGGKSGGELAVIPLLVYSKNQLAIEGWGGLKYEVLYSSDLKEWHVMETITLETSPQIYVDKTATEQPMRFYQLRLVE
jgi:cytohesin